MSRSAFNLQRKSIETFGESRALEAALRRTIRGEVRFDDGSRALYATDASNYRQVPIGLVIPRDLEDVAAAVAVCRKVGAPILPRGAGTSLAGQCCNVAVVLDFSKYMNQVLELDPEQRYARVQPGVVLDTLRDRAEAHRLTFAPDPSTHNRCTLGGMIGNNSCGAHSLWGGKTVDNVESLEVLLYDGTRMTLGGTTEAGLASVLAQDGRCAEIYHGLDEIRHKHSALVRERFPRIPRRVSGYNLDQLLPENGFHLARALVGTEGTCAIVLEAKVKLIPSRRYRTLVALGYPETFVAADAVPSILQFQPIALEGFEGSMIAALKRKKVANLELLPEAGGYLLVEFGSGEPGWAADRARQMVEDLSHGPRPPQIRQYDSSEARAVWRLREAGPRAAAFAPGAPLDWEGWEDSAVAPEKLGSYLRQLRALLDHYKYKASFYGHFGEACIHMRVSFDLQSRAGIEKYSQFIDDAADLVLSYGGSVSGEHGDGQARSALLPKMFGPELTEAFRKFKTLWDPGGKMNPHKIVDPHLPTQDLRLGADYHARESKTHFSYPDDQGSFARATLRCIGIGACRKTDAGTMCPSYRVTLEEQHSTRGRAHMLFELLQGEVIRDGWKDERVKDSLDLCLSCKACKGECPVSVDIATYKSEFLSHYYEGRWRPLRHYAFGWINKWARLGSFAPAAANFSTRAPGFSEILRALLRIPQERRIPQLARQTFHAWVRKSGPSAAGRVLRARSSFEPSQRTRVILWVDTFTNYFYPEAGRAAIRVLQDAGFEPVISPRHLCCGRPLYDFGMLAQAKRYLQRVLRELKAEILIGTPMIVLEPSCASVFRDETHNLFPNDPTAEGLRRQSFLLSEFLEQHAPNYSPPELHSKVLLHGHCHQKALMKMAHEESLLRRMGAELVTLDSGCCGMAGSFGLEKKNFALAQQIGEQALLPAVRAAAEDTIVVADGFSCREQIFQSTGRRARHLAEVMQTAIDASEG